MANDTMTTYQSEIKTISSGEEMVFSILSNLNNLEKIASNPSFANKAKDMQFDTDYCSFTVDGFGKVGFRIIERIPFSSIKLTAENTPVNITAQIFIDAIDDNQSTLKLVINANLPAMIKMMVGGKLQEGINTMAELLAMTLNK